MSSSALSLSALQLVLAFCAAAKLPELPSTPLADLRFPAPTDAPEHADPGGLERGDQFGYNRCNASTEHQNSRCQTSYVNDLSDFCLWAPPSPNSTIGDEEGEEVAWCTKRGHGTRLMPPGTLVAAQLLKAPNYVMITGLIEQTNINIREGDEGGELDPHGQDLRGNPIGGLMYSTQFSDGEGPLQVVEWTNFMGSNQFCIKICDPDGKNPGGFCQNRLDRLGCAYNAPSRFTINSGAAGLGVFETCESDDMDIPGIYVDGDGTTRSYSQPAESLGPITTVPYHPRLPRSSNCVPARSAELYTDVPYSDTPLTHAASAHGFVTSRTPAHNEHAPAATVGILP
ncbi:hypothetical protein K488DRAFT_43316 [Vararia minispora EC-137]|uniref:Uncharacterized protein n=1 Tax=Vararia minispora EC-137 TaxID=1314806 RepID=A0ACB8QUK8_9AGAM|nr:hypothetical protein K488DRAFT_43316 [Vararia minispora EC-137]